MERSAAAVVNRPPKLTPLPPYKSIACRADRRRDPRPIYSDATETHRLVGIYTGKILKGEKPGDLPVQRATKVELIINLKTAKALGIAIPIALSGRADELIE